MKEPTYPTYPRQYLQNPVYEELTTFSYEFTLSDIEPYLTEGITLQDLRFSPIIESSSCGDRTATTAIEYLKFSGVENPNFSSELEIYNKKRDKYNIQLAEWRKFKEKNAIELQLEAAKALLRKHGQKA